MIRYSISYAFPLLLVAFFLSFVLGFGCLPLCLWAEEKTDGTQPAEPLDIYITGALSPMGLERIGKPVSVITHQELQERAEPTVGELLASEPGVSSTYFGPGASRPVIRGQSKERVRVMENGLESGDVSRVSDDHAVAIDPLTVQRVDVLRGPSTLLYGSSAIGGVVNMIDESIAEQKIVTPVTGEIDLRKGDSADEEFSGATSLNGDAGAIQWHLSGFYRESDDIEIPGFAESERVRAMEEMEEEHEEGHEEEPRGTLANSDIRSKGFKLGGSHVWDSGFIGFALRTNDSLYGIPGAHSHAHEEAEHEDEADEEHENEHAEEDTGVRIDLDQVRLESRGELELDHDFFRTVRFGLSFSDYEHKELEGDTVGTKFTNDELEARIELTHQHQDGFEGGLGTQIEYEDFKAEGKEAFVPPSETISPALFAVEDYQLSDRFVLQLGGRYEFASVDPENIAAQDFHPISASTGVVWSLDPKSHYSLGFSTAYSERAPTATELFANGPHLAAQTFEIGDPALEKERSVGTELVFRKNSGRLKGSASLFWQHYLDYVNLTPTGEEMDELPVFAYGFDRARFWGFETELDYELLALDAHSLSFYGQVDFVRGENLSDDDPLPRITPLRGKLGLRYRHGRAMAYVEGILVDEQDRTADFEFPTDSYALLNVGASYELAASEENTYELYLRGTNLTDEEARVHTSFLKEVAPLRGQAFLAGVTVRF